MSTTEHDNLPFEEQKRDLYLLGKIRPFTAFPSPYRNMWDFVGSISRRMGKNRTYGDNTKEILVINGLPKSGKSTGRRILVRRSSLWLPESIPCQMIERDWERDGEEAVRAQGKILTEPGLPFTDQELSDSEGELEKSLVEPLRDDQTDLIVGEWPGGLVNRMESGEVMELRPLGAEVNYKLAHFKPPFDEFEGKYNLNIATFVGGPFMRSVLAYFHEEVNNAKTLDEAQRIAYIYGYKRANTGDRALTEGEWKDLDNGASLPQLEKIEDLTRLMLRILERNGQIPTEEVTQFRSSVGEQSSLLRAILQVEGVGSRSYLWGLPWFWNHFLTDEYNLNLPVERIFIGYNNPTQTDLGIDNTYRRTLLLNHLEQRRKVSP